VANETRRLLDAPAERETMKRELASVEASLHGPRGDAIARAADVVCEMLAAKATPGGNLPS